MIEGVEIIKRMHSVAASLTGNPELRRELARRMARHLLYQQQSVAILPFAAGSPAAPGDAPPQASAGAKPGAVDFTSVVAPHLTERQQQIWGRLMAGHGIRQIGRELGISHVAVLKHRKKIVEVTRSVLGGQDDDTDEGSADGCNWVVQRTV